MRRSILTIAFAAISAPALAQVGVSVSVSGPGSYGQINLGEAPRPQLIIAAPIVAIQAPEYASGPRPASRYASFISGE